MRAFSGEVAKHISSFDDSEGEQAPSIYRMIEEICEQNELSLVKVKIYGSGDVYEQISTLQVKKILFYETIVHLMPWL